MVTGYTPATEMPSISSRKHKISVEICGTVWYHQCVVIPNIRHGKGVSDMDGYILSFLISVMANVVSVYICKWLDGDL